MPVKIEELKASKRNAKLVKRSLQKHRRERRAWKYNYKNLKRSFEQSEKSSKQPNNETGDQPRKQRQRVEENKSSSHFIYQTG